MTQEEMKELENIIPDPSQDYEYERFEEDGEYLMGLVGAKIKERKAYKSEEMVKGYQLTFRSKDNPKVFVNQWVKASCHERSNMFKLLRNMTGGKLKKGSTNLETFEALKGCLGGWFDCQVECKPWAQNPEVIFNNLSDNGARPSKVEKGDCREYFGTEKAEVEPADEGTKAVMKDKENFDKDEIPF